MLEILMGHLSLYRKYRPQTFGEVVGQTHVTKTLQAAVEQDRVSHAFLFSGPRGTGKTSTARILAKALNCEKGGREPCNECSSCLQIAEGASLDVVEIDAASHGSVDDARDIREKVSYAPVSGRWKVYIIDECHMLSPAANNAMLKVLEEPPSHVVFVFATTESNKVLHTLIDRCQRYEFRAVGIADIEQRLAEVAVSEGIAADDDALNLIAGRAAGSVRDAFTLLDQLRSYPGERIDVDAVAQLFGSLPHDLLFEALDIVSERDAGSMFVFAERLARSGVDTRLFMHSLVGHLRSLFLVMHAQAAEEILDVTDEMLERLKGQANRFDASEMLRLIDLANECQVQLREGADPRLCLEVALARMARPDLHGSPSALLSRLERLESLVDGATAPPITPSNVTPLRAVPPQTKASPQTQSPKAAPKIGVSQSASSDPPKESDSPENMPVPVSATGAAEVADIPSGPLDLERIQRAWPLLLDKVKRRKISFQALLLAAHPVAFAGGELVLEFGPRSRFHRDKVSEPTQQEPLLEAFLETFGERPRILCKLGEEDRPAHVQSVGPEPSESNSRDDRNDEKGDVPQNANKDPIELIRDAFSGTEVVDE